MNGDESTPLYRLESVTKVYGGGPNAVHALKGITMEVGTGDFAVIVGASGSGKSTLLQLLGGLDRPTEGRLEFEGNDLARAADSALTEVRLRTIGFVFQQFNLIPTLSAKENVEVAAAPTGIGPEQRSRKALEMLARVGLEDRSGHLPSELSGGEQQRVAIARALVNEPDVLLADEPTGNLDSKIGSQILDLLRELWSETGMSVVLITHDAGIAADAPRVISLADGRILGDSFDPQPSEPDVGAHGSGVFG